MKFQCDRCKTRYSIAEERVRGKILKIRCKNCSAVITVREPKPESGSHPGVSEESGPERAATAAASPRAKAGSALLGAFEDVIRRPVGDREPEPSASDSFRAPDHFEQEWYVSVDGAQSGPFSLEQAKEWVGEQNPDDELHCWNEDFDDWLPVEKVSHFRGIRRLPPPPAGPPSRAQSPVVGSRPRTPRAASPVARPERPEDTPQPLFGPTLAAIEAEQGRARLENTPKPLFGPTLAAIEAEQGVAHSEKTPPPLFRPATPAPVGNAGFGGLDEPTEIAPAPAMAMVEAATAAANQAVVSRAIPGTESMPDDDQMGDLDFEIGEASRMVKLPMLVPPSGGVSQPVPAAPRELPGVAKLDKDGRGSGSQAAMPLVPLSETALAGAQPEILSVGGTKRPALLIPLLLGGAVVIAVAVGVLVYFGRDGEDNGSTLAKSRLYGDDLSYRPDNLDQVRVVTKEVIKENPVIKWRNGTSGNNTSSNGNGTKNPNGTAGGPTDLGPNLPADQYPLSPADVIKVSRENALGNRRCYENALKKDPFLDVKSIKVTLTVAPSGVVTNLVMSSHAETVLGECLQSRIRKWVFRKSPAGITTQLTLSFEQS